MFCLEGKAGVTALLWSRGRMETPESPKTAQTECVEEASCEKTPLKMKASFTESPKAWLQVQLPELAPIPEGQEEPPHCQQLHNGNLRPFEAHTALSSQEVLCPRSWEHPWCSLCNSRCANTDPQIPLAAGEEQRHSGEQFPSPSSWAASPKVGAVYWHLLIMLMTHKLWWQQGCATTEGTVHHGDGTEPPAKAVGTPRTRVTVISTPPKLIYAILLEG